LYIYLSIGYAIVGLWMCIGLTSKVASMLVVSFQLN